MLWCYCIDDKGATMSTQEPSYFETDQLSDQPQNQPQDEQQKDAEMAAHEMSADVSSHDVPIEFSAATDEVAPEDEISLPMPPSSVRVIPAWRLTRQNQHELRSMLIGVLVAAVVTCLAFMAGMGYLGAQKSTETYILVKRAHQRVVINNDQGSISIHCQSKGPFGFQVQRYSQGFGPGLIGMDVVYTQYGVVATVTAHVPPDILFVGPRGINIDVTVPVADELKVHTGKGFITLKGLAGDVVAMTDSGSLTVKNCQGNMALRGK
jgi:hypothetical protein